MRTVKSSGTAAAMCVGLALLTAPSAAFAQPLQTDPADTAWMLTASALVLFMTLPGLALFYGGLVRQKNLLSVMMQCVAITCIASLLWFAAGYSLAFSLGTPWLGDLSKTFLGSGPRHAVRGTLSEPIFFMFQTTFAAITPALIIGAIVERTKFSAVLIFSALWLILVYAPVTHWIWGGGWLATLGVMDYAGGLVVHATAGISALLFAQAVGPREGFPKEASPPHSPGLTMIGTGMLWVGWFGFNGGSALAANADAGMAIVCTHLSACMAGIVWAGLEWAMFGRPSLVGAVTGVVAGLATVTPASGFISPASAVLMGACGSLVCFFAVPMIKQRLKIDDALDVFAVHGVGGMLGILMLSALASPALGGSGFLVAKSIGAQFGVQILGMAVTVIWSGVASLAILALVKALVGLRASDFDIEDGLDLAAHGERASQS